MRRIVFSSSSSSTTGRTKATTMAAAWVISVCSVSAAVTRNGGCAAFSHTSSSQPSHVAIRQASSHIIKSSAFFRSHGGRPSSSWKWQNPHVSRRQGRSPGPLFMADWWQSFFGGGAYNLAIDYDSLEYPAPELAECAKQGDIPLVSPSKPHLELATFAGGCFWGLELAFQRTQGVEYTVVGYTQGSETCPNYEQVGAGNTGHTEAVCVYFDPKVVSYSELVAMFLKRIDPTTVNGQGRDYGKQYRTGIYYHSEAQKQVAQSALAQAQSSYTKPIATEWRPAMPFWPAEDYHQQYLAKGGRFGVPQSTEKNCQDEIRCYG